MLITSDYNYSISDCVSRDGVGGLVLLIEVNGYHDTLRSVVQFSRYC